jgi:hypothetical protein
LASRLLGREGFKLLIAIGNKVGFIPPQQVGFLFDTFG